jgi:hypothetical protein
MNIPENLSKYITTDEQGAVWHDARLSKYNIGNLRGLSDSDLAEINANGLFKRGPDGSEPIAPDKICDLFYNAGARRKGCFWNKNGRHNARDDYKIDWQAVRERGLFNDFPTAQMPPVEHGQDIRSLPDFPKRFPFELIQRLSKITKVQYENIFSRDLLYNPYLNTGRWYSGSDNGNFIHNPKLLNERRGYYSKGTKSRKMDEEVALGYGFWNHLLWLAGLSTQKWRKIHEYNLLAYKTEDMIVYMRLSDDTLKKISEKSFYKTGGYCNKTIWNSIRCIGGLDDLCVRKYGKVYEDVAHFPKLQILKEKYEKQEEEDRRIGALFMAYLFNFTGFLEKDKSVLTLKNFGVDLPADPSAGEIKNAMQSLARLYHPDKAPAGREKDYTEKFKEISAAVWNLRKCLEHKSRPVPFIF